MLSFKEIDNQVLGTLVSEGPLRLIDVRNPGETARGVLPGAESVPLHLLPLRAAEFGSDETLVFYCQSGARSAQACAYMASHGFRSVYNLRGGIVVWLQSGRPLAQLAAAEGSRSVASG